MRNQSKPWMGHVARAVLCAFVVGCGASSEGEMAGSVTPDDPEVAEAESDPEEMESAGSPGGAEDAGTGKAADGVDPTFDGVLSQPEEPEPTLGGGRC